MKLLVVCGILSFATMASAESRTPVLLELFTSEGCSSCPPADALLARLMRTQPVAGVELIALSEHVDYWNYLGWRDPFSAAQFTDRQAHYAVRLHSRTYTPQLVVDGGVDLVGSDEASALAAIRTAAATRKGTIVVRRDLQNRAVLLHTTVNGIAARAEVFVALIEDGLVSQVQHGENQGQSLPHTAVVRLLKVAGNIENGAWSGDTPLPLDGNWKRDQLRAVVFAQAADGHILATATIPLS